LLLLVFLALNLSYTFAQTDGRITGVVIDAKNGPIPGTTIQVKGTGNSTSTDGNGAFSIAAKPGDVLVVTSVSYVKKEIAVTTSKKYKVELEETNTALKEVVVVGYGTTKQKELTSAITTIKAESFNAGVVTSPASLLEGKVAGLNITSDGNPNAVATVTLRGPSSLRGGDASTPFYVIDGVPGADFNLVAPSDIASMDILKDASAAAIYGSRATNGVIIITTKKAKPGQVRMAYNAYASVDKIANQFQVASADQLRAYAKANGQVFSSANDNGGNTNWQKEVERNSAFSQNHNLSFGGGTDKTTFGGSINYLQNQGIVKTSGLDRFIGNLNVSQKNIK